ncbi:MAG TPA: outer membrane beta-barrel protein [Ohtaekwangia sp.]|uniref:outer membrane beta-barrel protein n=1 Tax=Ohtaekwangia sp. TaxID=2066019 RepID=UPI002F924EE1
MKSFLLVCAILFLSISCYSQIIFEKGYFIDNAGQKMECLIKNMDWRSNPTAFDYKLSESDKSKTETIASVKEFGIYTVARYKRYTVKIDRSSESINEMSNNRNPEFVQEQLFLKALIEGKASLYQYTDGNLTRFFYQTDSIGMEQLVFKPFLTPDKKIGRNNAFRQQLLNTLKCESLSKKDVEKLAYKRKELVTLFEKYNKCQGSEIVNLGSTSNKDFFNLTVRAGINSSSLTLSSAYNSIENTNFSRKQSFRSGIELEFILPFNKNKWSIIIEPSYQHYKNETTINSQTVKADYRVLELPIGARHYFFLNERNKLFINASFIYSYDGNSKLDFKTSEDIDISSDDNLAFGVGYKFGNRYSIELRQQTNRNIARGYVFWGSAYNTTSLIIGFSIF